MISDKKWQSFVDSRPEANFLQSLEWANANNLVGYKIVRNVVEKDGQVVAGWQGIVKDAKRGRYLEIPGGPLGDWGDESLVNQVFEQLKQAGCEHKCIFVRLRPQIEASDKTDALLKKLRAHKAPFHLHAEHTNILDLSPSEDDLLANMRRQTRYEIRQAIKKDVKVSWSSDPEAVDEFFAIQTETAKRQGFIPPSRSFLEAQMSAFGKKARIYRAEKDGQVLALALVIFSGSEAVYFEAASTPESRRYPGAYAIQWQAIRDAKNDGLKRYNFWGIAYSDNPNHRYAGVTTFKRGFGGQDITFTAAHDIVLRHNYIINLIIETIRKKRRKL